MLRLILILCLLVLYDHGDKTKYRTDSEGGVEECRLVCILAEHRDAEKVGCTDHAAKGGDEDVKELEEVDEDNARKDRTYDADDPKEDLGVKELYIGELKCDKCECEATAVKATRRTDEEHSKLVKNPCEYPAEDSTNGTDNDGKVNTLGESVGKVAEEKGCEEKIAEVTARNSRRDRKLNSQDTVAVKCGKHKCEAVDDEEKEVSVHLLENLCIGFCKCFGVKRRDNLVHIYSILSRCDCLIML